MTEGGVGTTCILGPCGRGTSTAVVVEAAQCISVCHSRCQSLAGLGMALNATAPQPPAKLQELFQWCNHR